MEKIMFIVIAVIISINANVLAQEKQNFTRKYQMHQNNYCNMDIPNLSDEQKEKIEKFRIDHMKEMLQFKNQLAEKVAKKQTLMTADDPDINVINTIIDEIGAIKIEMMKKQAEGKLSIRNLLNDDQKVFFDMHGNKHGNKMLGKSHPEKGKCQGHLK